MGSKIIITEYTGCSYDIDEIDINAVHAISAVGGDESTYCGIPLCDEAAEYKDTNKPVTCGHCINQLESTPRYSKRKGKWY